MTIKDTIHERLIAAMKNRDAEKVGIYRYLLSQFKNQEINLRHPLNPEEEIKLLQSEAKKRKESIVAYQNGNRPELAEKEQTELNIIQEFLPQQIGDEELKQIIEKAISNLPDKDFGSAMKVVMPFVHGQADGTRVSGLVKSLL